RLIKETLQATFPTATKAFYFPSAELINATQVLVASDMNNTQYVDTSGGNVAFTLPTLGSGDKGWSVRIVKTGVDANAAIVAAASGSISAKAGTVATIRVGIPYEPAEFFWNGGGWYCFKWGPAIGSTEIFNGATVPPGYLLENAQVYSNTAYAELFAVLGSTTLKDKRGRLDIGAGAGSGLTNRVLGTNYGGETTQLSTTNLPAQTPAGSVSITSITFDTRDFFPNVSGSNDTTRLSQAQTSGNITIPSGNPDPFISGTATFTGTPMPGQNATPFAIIPPSVASNKIIRAC
ncbi:MAG TPA: phage tail protein, partial [Pyrinomonadaceae bacterium]